MSSVIQTRTSVIEVSTVVPIDVSYARLHLRSISDVDDELIESWILAARDYFEEQTGRPIMIGTFEDWLDAFPYSSRIELARTPLVSVESVTYIASDGSTLPVTDGASPETDLWQVGKPAGVYATRGWIEPIQTNLWPTPRVESGAVRIRYTAGYAETPSEVPALIKAILLLLVGQFDQFRSQLNQTEGGRIESLPFGIDQMIAAFKYSAYPSQVLYRP